MKSKRVVTKIGDIFSVKIEKNSKRHFQLIAFDLTQLNSDVIRAFATAYPVSAEPNISDIVNDEVDFYAHCVIKWGVRLGFWEKIGNAVDVGELNDILFRDTSDYGHSEGEEPIRKSNN